jgi:hypothetical protein
MMEDIAKEKPAAPTQPAAAPSGDLSKEIEQQAQRKPEESIKAVRVFDNYYRCNWRVQDKSEAFWLATPTITKSRLLRATMTSGGLVIEDMTLGKLPVG